MGKVVLPMTKSKANNTVTSEVHHNAIQYMHGVLGSVVFMGLACEQGGPH